MPREDRLHAVNLEVCFVRFGDRCLNTAGSNNEYRNPGIISGSTSRYTVREKVLFQKSEISLNFSIYNLLGRRIAYSIFWQKDGDSQQYGSYRLQILDRSSHRLHYSYNNTVRR